jgi:hypothetical protein
MAVQIQYRRGPAAEWTGINPTLALGEPGFETDTGRIKVGTGGTAWNDLTYTAADSFLNGDGAPDASLGKVGDFYLDTSIYHLYGPKTDVVGNEWGAGVYLTGNTIRTGTIAPDASVGRDGDFYIDTVANQIYGPKTDTVGDEWGSPTNLQVVSIDDLGDVDTSTAPPQAGEALVWDDVSSVWKPGPAGAEASGAIGQIQYNDGASPTPGLAASADLTWDNTAKELGIGGDINLDSGGTFATIIQSVTPTANRTISFPDQTGTVGLVSGATGNIQYNNAGQLAGTGDLTVDLNWTDTLVTYTGLKVNVTDTGSAAGSSILDLQINGTSRLKHSYTTSNDNILSLDTLGFNKINSNGGTIVQFPGANATNTQPLSVFTGAGVALGPNGSQVFLRSGAANVLEQRNLANPQTLRLYNTTDQPGNNYQRTSITDDSTGLIIDQQYATDGGGPGAARSNLLDLQDNGASKLTVTSSGRLLVGTSIARSNFFSGAPTLQIEGISTAASQASITCNTANANPPRLNLAKTRNNGTTSGMEAVIADDVLGVVAFSGADGTNFIRGASISAEVDGNPGTNNMPGRLVFSTTAPASSPTERMRITSDGYARLSANSGGIQFNGDTAAANALNDYEEGTWTPVIEGTSEAGTGTYVTQSGNYTKIGNSVLLRARVRWSAHTGTGSIFISGLPFSASVLSSFSMRTADGLTVSANKTYIDQSTGKLVIEATITGTGDIILGGQYQN